MKQIKKFALELNQSHMALIGDALGRLPYVQVVGTIEEIKRQVAAQPNVSTNRRPPKPARNAS